MMVLDTLHQAGNLYACTPTIPRTATLHIACSGPGVVIPYVTHMLDPSSRSHLLLTPTLLPEAYVAMR